MARKLEQAAGDGGLNLIHHPKEMFAY